MEIFLILLYLSQNQILLTGKTDKNGKFEVEEKFNKNLQDRKGIFYIEAYDKGKKSRTVLDPRTMRWNLSTFDEQLFGIYNRRDRSRCQKSRDENI